MTRRALFGLATLCVASFCVMFLWMKPGGTLFTSAARPPAEPRAYPVARDTLFGSARMPVAGGTGTGQIGDPAASPPDFEAARRDALSAPDAEDRVRALQLLADAPPELSMDVLVGATTNAAEASERATAITSLRQLAQRGPVDARVRNAFLAAASDADPLVVVVAQSALEEFDGPRQP